MAHVNGETELEKAASFMIATTYKIQMSIIIRAYNLWHITWVKHPTKSKSQWNIVPLKYINKSYKKHMIRINQTREYTLSYPIDNSANQENTELQW